MFTYWKSERWTEGYDEVEYHRTFRITVFNRYLLFKYILVKDDIKEDSKVNERRISASVACIQ